MYTIEDLRNILGLRTKNQARNRINAIRDLLESRGFLSHLADANKLSVSDEGVQLLRRLQEMIKAGANTTQAVEQLKIELGETEPPMDRQALRLLKIEVDKTIPLRFDELEGRVEALEHKRPWWEKIRYMLPRGHG